MALTNAYSTLVRFKEFANIPDAGDDGKAELSLNAASRQIDSHCGRRFFVDDNVSARTYTVGDQYCVWIDDFSTTTGLVVKTDADYDGTTFETTLTIGTHFVVEPIGAASASPVRPYTALRINTAGGYTFPPSVYGVPTLQVTAKWGWPAVPDDVEAACLLQARQLFKAYSATFGAFSLGDNGVSMRVRQMDQVAEGLLVPYRRIEC